MRLRRIGWRDRLKHSAVPAGTASLHLKRYRMRIIVILACIALLAAVSGWTQEKDEQSPRRSEPAMEDARDVVPDNYAALLEEVRALRADVLRLQQTVDSLAGGEWAQLRAENDRLRREMRELTGMTGQSLPPVPMPDRALLEGLYPPSKAPEDQQEPIETQQDKPDAAQQPDSIPEVKAVPETSAVPEPFSFEVVEEWGRTPEELATGNRQGTSLKGMIGVVPRGSSDDDLIALGRSLHEQYAAFDNINIEVFDDAEAARSYKGKYVAPPKHRVLSISKHKATGRDVILLIRDEKAVAVPLATDSRAP